MTDLQNSPHDLLNRRIEEAFEAYWCRITNGGSILVNRKDLHEQTFRACAKWAFEYVKELEKITVDKESIGQTT